MEKDLSPLRVLTTSKKSEELTGVLYEQGVIFDGSKLIMLLERDEKVVVDYPCYVTAASHGAKVTHEVKWAGHEVHVRPSHLTDKTMVVIDASTPGFRFFPMPLPEHRVIYTKDGLAVVMRTVTATGASSSMLSGDVKVKKVSSTALPYRVCNRFELDRTDNRLQASSDQAAADVSLKEKSAAWSYLYVRGDDSVMRITLASKQHIELHSGVLIAWTNEIGFHFKGGLCCRRVVSGVEGPGVVWIASPRISRPFVRTTTAVDPVF
ncbi:unnamed protein product [Vitrella brassicaformis CCMP3155]|uniref:Altered inheritance of mitochondria protein 24, mitochondrial n=2 Tax=Vitrella brassicaformis TaxID=1169539 RepID=A0A0G4ERC5_VITBC|nr:unnamed protein product [Vitrella brassicaformis CCMP3155]|eukprot:CEL99979.1 unnamed protein product [Vitrella brassicaformis CCMP3155]